jgi:hypothetical protein
VTDHRALDADTELGEISNGGLKEDDNTLSLR